ncbi:MAG: LytTR family transcriptional regulator [Prolixibacteraceae bacterium]|nr:LytTR family transcriptional regulator [Prolixibacteraceae bacterium]
MKSRIYNPYYHIVFWIVVITILILIYGRSWQNSTHAFYFILMLLPLVMGTSYVFNYYLVPYYLLKKKYFWFSLYFFYTLVISLYFQMMVVLFSFMYLANFKLEDLGPNSISDIVLLAFIMYFIVFVGSFLVMLQQLADRQSEIEHFMEEKKKMEKPVLEILSNRQLVRILYDDIIYIESLSDYIKVHSNTLGETTSKEKISVLEEKLPEQFLRIHRSFIINTKKITRYNSNEVELRDIHLNIGRSYKKEVIPILMSM